MIGTGTFSNNKLSVPELIQPVGTQFGADFNPAGIEYRIWGSLTMDFESENSDHISYDSDLEGYGSGDYPIERLAKPMLAECD